MRTASLAVKNGYKHSFVYSSGLPDWEKSGYPLESDVTYPAVDIPTISGGELKSMIDAGEDIVVVDIRDSVDFNTGRIAGSLNIALDDMHERWKDLPGNKKIVLTDRHGKQVRTAARYLAYKGLGNLAMLENGFIDGWKNPGFPLKEEP